MKYKMINGKMVVEKQGVYFSLTKNQRVELRKLLDNADENENDDSNLEHELNSEQ